MGVRPEQGDRVVYVDTKSRIPRDFFIKKEDGEKHGFTRGCPGCNSWFRGLARQAHSDACRERFRGLLREDARIKNAEARKRIFDEKEMERRRRKLGGERKRKKKRGRGRWKWVEQ